MTTPPPPGPQIFELPGPREVVSRGFDVIVAATSQIRQASVYIGFLVLLVTGPAIAFGAVFFAAAPESLVSDLAALAEEAERGVQPGPELGPWASSFLLLVFVGTTALVGVLVVSIEAQIMAVAILGGHVAGRPLQLREALIRSRQVFWRMVRAAFLVAIPVYLTQLVVTTALGPGSSPDPNVDLGGAGLLASFLGALVGMPFSYVPSAIVLGDVGAREALARSFRLARARWRLALVVALFPAVFSSVQILALGAGGDVVVRLAEALGLGFDGGALRAAVTLVVILAAVAAIGSLIFTMSALLAAPQVVAFVGLTHYVAGLDRARLLPESQGSTGPAGPAVTAPTSAWTVPAPAPTFRWISGLMLAGFVGMAFLAAIGILLVANARGA